MKRDVILLSVGLILGLIIAAVICVWKAKPGHSTVPIVAPEIAHVPTITEKLPVKTYPTLVNKKLGIPPTDKVLTSTIGTPTKRPQTVTAAIDSEGTTRLYVRTDPLPWFSRAKKQQLSMTYGVMDRAAVKRLEYRYDMLHIKQMDIGFSAEANILTNNSTHSLIGINFSYSW